MTRRSKKENLVFLIVFLLIIVFGFLTLFKVPKTYSSAENRDLAQFSMPNVQTFLDGSFQDNLESAMSDQFTGSGKIREAYNGVLKSMPTLGIDDEICKNEYVSLGQGRSTFNCGSRIVYDPIHFTYEQKTAIKENVKQFNNLNNLADTYYYVINDPAVFDFRINKLTEDMAKILKNNMNGYKAISSLKFSNYKEAKKIFYKTDHHWNYYGAQRGYEDIAKMMNTKKVYKPTETFHSGENFFGSHARNIRNYDFPEEFVAYKYKLPPHDSYINGERAQYNGILKTEKHDYEYDKNINFYGLYYGSDYAEVMFDYHQPDKKNLLIVANSYSNAINELVAAGFDKTYIIDPRHNMDWRAKEYIKNNDIDKVLVILSDKLLTAEGVNFGMGVSDAI